MERPLAGKLFYGSGGFFAGSIYNSLVHGRNSYGTHELTQKGTTDKGGYTRPLKTGKVSPVHFFWGSFDLAVTRFSGREAPPHPGGIPNFPDWVAREAYSHEVSSVGFWPGGGGIDYPAFYSYAYPFPDGFSKAKVQPAGAFWSDKLREFVLPYDEVRSASSPDDVLLDFLQTTYEAAAACGKWDRTTLERELVPSEAR